MITTLMLDLDGTLLRLDMDEFLQAYLRRAAARVVDLVPAEKFINSLLAATEAMVKDKDPDKTNREVFEEDFSRRLGSVASAVMDRFDEFYRRDFPLLKEVVSPNPAAREVLSLARTSGLELVIATNPVFPRQPVLTRLAWAQIADFPFKLITSYEIMHYCKPNLEYYREVLKMLGRRPSQCLMVGNDVEEDVIAGKLGINTYLATDCLIDRGSGLRPDYRGPLSGLPTVLKDEFQLATQR